MNLKERAEQLKIDIPALFIALKYNKTPIIAKAVALLAVAYALSPIDFIPDFIPVIGILDDLIIVPALIALFIKLIPADVFDKCRRESAGLWYDGKPKRWYYAIPIVLTWLLLILVIVAIIWL